MHESTKLVLQVRGWKTPGTDLAQSGSEHQDLQASKRKIAALEVSNNALVSCPSPLPNAKRPLDMPNASVPAPDKDTS